MFEGFTEFDVEVSATTFAVVGHDRGARCAYRLALDAPEAVTVWRCWT